MKTTILLATAILVPTVWAADPDSGKEIYHDTEYSMKINGEMRDDVSCATCHSPEFYTREDRLALNYGNLRYWVGACNMNMDVGWFPEDVEDVVAYLNREYYNYEYSPETN